MHVLTKPSAISNLSSGSTAGARMPAQSQDPYFSSIPSQQPITPVNDILQEHRPPTTSATESELAGRVVGRGGSGSRRRVVVLKHDIFPKLVNPGATTTDLAPMSLRPSGRGGLASRPKQLAPPPPSLQPHAPQSNTHPVHRNQSGDTNFIRPSGRGGAGAHSTSPFSFRDILDKRQSKAAKTKAKAQKSSLTTLRHPIPSHLAYEITNMSTETLSTLHFAGESTSPLRTFFPEDSANTLDPASEDDLASTPPFSATASTFEGSLSLQSTHDGEESDYDIYLEDSASHVPADVHHQRSFNKLVQKFGANPYDAETPSAHLADAAEKLLHGHPKDRQPLTNDRTTKMFRRASLSMTSIFSRPSGRRDSIGVDSQNTLETITDDLHQLGLQDDAGYDLNSSRISSCDSPRSPILFSPPSPTHQPKRELSMPSADNSELSVPASTLPLPHPVKHNRSLSSTLSSGAFSDGNEDIVAPANWLFPPSDDGHDFKMAVTRNLTDKPTPWTGEWNTDMYDVIRALRELR
ncbi:hypothetical protein HYPSUDRAFT_672059 [Hypholoma sublateritium FD-334 SS-4]|uniref:Uncharacterized protein n=1 Tax=Hypholoma sublateritium (strain FD-334 SS-4) TaxID=945553 RepID=A0A0D2L563_HYPSF|nr:hypothetical protein HYPSUDRAFT_672059 [Hypholoma sublateritium FD-334 SS-4]